jgi:hypothetical protein
MVSRVPSLRQSLGFAFSSVWLSQLLNRQVSEICLTSDRSKVNVESCLVASVLISRKLTLNRFVRNLPLWSKARRTCSAGSITGISQLSSARSLPASALKCLIRQWQGSQSMSSCSSPDTWLGSKKTASTKWLQSLTKVSITQANV